MQYLPGGVLNLKQAEPMPWLLAVNILLPIARALAYAHGRNIIHPAIQAIQHSPDRRRCADAFDLGIAKILESTDGGTLTGAGMTTGTPEYMAPEQWLGQAGPLSDLYSLGVVLFELVTGSKPYTADTPIAIMLKQINDPPPLPRLFRPDLPVELENVLAKGAGDKTRRALSEHGRIRQPTWKCWKTNSSFRLWGGCKPQPEDNTIPANSEIGSETGKDIRLGGAGLEPPEGGIPASPMPSGQPGRARIQIEAVGRAGRFGGFILAGEQPPGLSS